MGLSVVVALVANGAALGAATAAVYGTFGAALIGFAASSLFNSALNALFGPRSPTGFQQDLRQRLRQQTELPIKRHVRGRCFSEGTPTPGIAKDGFYYVAYLLNSRESVGNFEVYLDDRVLQVTGDPYDFAGPGASATNGLFNGHVNYWITRGEKTSPPDVFLNEAGFDAADPVLNALGYKATDAGRGCTIIYLKLKRGTDGTFQDRWPGYPFVNVSVLGDWSKVWDPRDPAQSVDDKSTHTFSRNQALQALDLATQNPFNPYSVDFLEMGQWIAAANVADEIQALKDGGSEPRYQCDGTTIFDGTELEQLMQPIMAAGASSLVRSGGKLGVVPAAPKNTATVINDMLGLPSVSTISAPEAQYDEVHVTYSPLARDGKAASLRPWPIPGVVGAGLPRVLSIDLGMVSSATQAMRIRKIEGLRTTYTRRLEGVCFPDAFDALAGSWGEVSLGYERLDGVFQVASMTPGASLVGDDEGIAIRIPTVLEETSPAIFEWNPFTDEEDVGFFNFVYDEDGLQPGGPISIETGDTVNQNTGGTIIPRVKFTFAPSPSANISGYQLQVAEQGEAYSQTVTIDADALDGGGDIFGFFSGSAGQPYDFRIRAISATGFSDYVEFTGATPVVDIALDPPVFNSVTGGAGQIDIDVAAPNDPDVRSIEVVESDTNDASAGNVFFESAATQNQVFQFSLTGLAPDTTKFIFARVKGDFSSVSVYASGGSATTDP